MFICPIQLGDFSGYDSKTAYINILDINMFKN